FTPDYSQRSSPVGTWLSLVEHSLGVRGVGSSNLPVPTIVFFLPRKALNHRGPGGAQRKHRIVSPSGPPRHSPREDTEEQQRRFYENRKKVTPERGVLLTESCHISHVFEKTTVHLRKYLKMRHIFVGDGAF